MPTDIQNQIINDLEIVTDFDVDHEVERRINFLKDYLRDNGLKSYVLGISGGVDSTTAGKLAQLAVDSLRNEGYECQFIAVRLPYGIQRDAIEADAAVNFIRPDDVFNLNIKKATDAAFDDVDFNNITRSTPELRDFVKGNVKARQRMVFQYAVAGLHNGLVIGTDHGAEAIMGFFTKFGDGAADILPLSGLTKRRVRAIAAHLGVPAKLVNKTPTADLEDDRPQLPDEVAHGVTYDQIDDFLEGKDIDQNAYDIIVKTYNKTKHKRALPVTP